MRGDLAAVTRAIVLDPEARGDFHPEPTYGHLLEPALFITRVLRAFHPTSDGVLASNAASMEQDVFRPASVFSFYPPGYRIVGGQGLLGPEFKLDDSATALARANFVNTVVFSSIAPSLPDRPIGHEPRFLTVAAARGRPDGTGRGAERPADAPGDVAGHAGGDHHRDPGGPGQQCADAREDRRVSRGQLISVSSGAMTMTMTRRDFMRQGGCAMGAAALALQRFGLVNALAQSGGYQALVCIFLFGGNDSNNVIIPVDDYASYAAVRGTATGLNIPVDTLLPISPPSAGSTFGLHPSLSALQPLWNQKRLAIVCNVGPLVEPITRARYLARNALIPLNLFSHSDQQGQWQTCVSTGPSATGWGGRTADRLDAGSAFPLMVTVAGLTPFHGGRRGPAAGADARAGHSRSTASPARTQARGTRPCRRCCRSIRISAS